MYHQFSTKIAKQYGLEESILLENIYFWVKKNKANNQNYHNGKYWTYNTVKAFNELFDYMTEAKIYRALKKLKDCGLIEIGEYNENKYDHTKWYTVTSKALELFGETEKLNVQNEKQILQNEEPILQNEKSKLQNDEITITDNKQQIINTDNKQQIKGKQFTPPSLEDVAEYCKERNNNIDSMQFVDYYSARGWRFNNGGKMKDWRATVRTWERRNYSNNSEHKDFFSDCDKKTF